jgi:hypothetical protein
MTASAKDLTCNQTINDAKQRDNSHPILLAAWRNRPDPTDVLQQGFEDDDGDLFDDSHAVTAISLQAIQSDIPEASPSGADRDGVFD